MDKRELGRKIRQLRDAKGYSQDNVAAMLGIHQNTYCEIETGKAKLSLERYLKLSEILEVDAVEMLKWILGDSMVFNNNHQNGGNAANVIVDNASEKLLKTLEETVAFLKEENIFLRSLLQIEKTKE